MCIKLKVLRQEDKAVCRVNEKYGYKFMNLSTSYCSINLVQVL